MMLRCLWIRRRVGPYLDRALPAHQAPGVARHLTGCAGCREWARRQERLAALVRGVARELAEPNWTGFWSGIRTRILTESPVADRSPWRARPAWPLGWFPRLALGSAVAGILFLGLVLWRSDERAELLAPGIVVRALEVANPDTSVMVFATPEQEMTVIWVFGLGPTVDQSLRQSEEVRQAWLHPSWSASS